MIFATGAVLLSLNDAYISQLFAYVKELAESSGRLVAPFSSSVRAIFSAGWIIGPPVGFFLLTHIGFGLMYGSAAGLLLLTVLLSRWFLPALPAAPGPARDRLGTHLFGIHRVIATVPRRTWLLLGAATAVNIADQVYLIVIALYVTRDLHRSAVLVGLMAGICAALEIPLMITVGRLADRIGKLRVVAAAVVLAAMFFCLLPVAGSATVLIALQLPNAMWTAVITSIPMVVVQQEVPQRRRWERSDVTIRFVSVVGGDTSLLDTSIAHYRGLGAESFHLARHIESFDDPELQRSQDVMARHGLSFAAVHQGPWDEDLNAYLIRAQMRRHPGDWWVVADLDEFHVYDRPLADVIADCEAGGYEYVKGALLDRVAADGSLPALKPGESIWAQFPLAGLVSLHVPGAGSSKVTLTRGDVQLHLGQHGAITGRLLPAEAAFPQVHHFKWTDSVLARLIYRKQAYSSGGWHLTYPDTVDESRRMLKHLDANSGRINITAEEFAMRRCGSDYTDYEPWPALVPMLKGRR